MAEIAKRVTGKAPAMVKAKDPYFFMKTAAGSIIGNGTPARLPSLLAASGLGGGAGRRDRAADPQHPEDQALNAVAGYLIVNDCPRAT